MTKIFVTAIIPLFLAFPCFSQYIEYGAVVGVTKGIFDNTIASFNDDEFTLTSGVSPVFGIYGQRRYGTLFNVGAEAQLSSHDIIFSHKVENDFLSYQLKFTENITQIKLAIVNQSDVYAWNDYNVISLWIGLGGSYNTFNVASWEDDISIKQDDTLNYNFSTTDNVGREVFIPEGFIGLSYSFDKPFFIFKNASIRLTYNYLFTRILDKPTEYSFTYNRGNGKENHYDASWAGRLTYFDLVLRLAVF